MEQEVSTFLLRRHALFLPVGLKGKIDTPNYFYLRGPKMASDLGRCLNRRDRHHHCLVHVQIATTFEDLK